MRMFAVTPKTPRKILATALLFGATLTATAAEGGVSPYGYELFSILGIPITNAFVTGLVFAAVLLLLLRRFALNPQRLPSKGQLVVETIFKGVMDMMEPIVGKRMVRPSFPIVASLFLFILIQNWSGLLPGVGAFGGYDTTEDAQPLQAEQVAERMRADEEINVVDGEFYAAEDTRFEYLFRPANTDINNTIALAIAAHIAWLILIFRHEGWKSILNHIFGNKADKKDVGATMWFALIPVFLLVGFIELVSIAIRPLTLSARLFGNIYGGESMLDKIMSIAPWYIPVGLPFYMLELLVGFVQAMVFALLVSVYIGLMCNHGDDHEHGDGDQAHAH